MKKISPLRPRRGRIFLLIHTKLSSNPVRRYIRVAKQRSGNSSEQICAMMKTMTARHAIGLWSLAVVLVSSSMGFGSEPRKDGELAARMSAVIFPLPLTPVGETFPQQFTSILRQISDTYEAKWKQPLPLFINLDAAYQIARSKNDSFGCSFRDAPLSETLRAWCTLASLRFDVVGDQIIISPESKQPRR